MTVFDNNGVKTEWVIGDGSVSVNNGNVNVSVDFVQEHTSNSDPKEVKEKILKNTEIFSGSLEDIEFDKMAIKLKEEISKLREE
jgi:F0F1-type ATP synthase epsilon subunit